VKVLKLKKQKDAGRSPMTWPQKLCLLVPQKKFKGTDNTLRPSKVAQCWRDLALPNWKPVAYSRVDIGFVRWSRVLMKEDESVSL